MLEDDGTGATRGSTGVGLSKEVTEIMGKDVQVDVATLVNMSWPLIT